MIVLNETSFAEDAIKNKDIGKKPFETLHRVARYYLDNGYSAREARDKLDDFYKQCRPYDSPVVWSNLLDSAFAYAKKHKAIVIDSIDITDTEMGIINNLPERQTRRLAFTLLCLAKYWNQVNPKNDNWANNEDSEVMKLANINTSVKRQCNMFHSLYELGLIRFATRPDNPHCKVLFVSEGNVVMRITDLRNLGNQYLMFIGEPYFQCENCGVVVKYKDTKNRRNQKYCPSCAVKVKTKQSVESVMRKRARDRAASKQIPQSVGN